MNKHTPTPWKVDGNSDVFSGDPSKGTRKDIACIQSDNYAEDAEFIVRACNAHDDLLEALERIVNLPIGDQFMQRAKAFADARAVIAKARGENDE